MNYMDQGRMKKTETTSFGEYFDDQRDRIVKDMQDKNKQQNVEWMERYQKRQEAKKQLALLKKMAPVGPKEKKLLEEMMQEERLFWWESIGT